MKHRRLILLALLIIQNTASALLGRFIRSASVERELFSISHFIIISEVAKLILSIVCEALRTNGTIKMQMKHTYKQSKETMKMAIPALLYLGSNNLLYIALTNLTVPTFQLACQMKLVITATVSFLVLNRTYSLQQWCCLIFISCALGIIATESPVRPADKDDSTYDKNILTGLGAVALSCLFSSLAGVYFEKWIKEENQGSNLKPTISLWMKNFQLALWSLAIACVQCYVTEDEMLSEFFYGFDAYVWTQVCLLAVGGLLVASVLKYSDNVVKGLATGLSTVASIVLSTLFFGTRVSFPLIASVTIVFAATFSFLNPRYMEKWPSTNKKFCLGNLHRVILFSTCFLYFNLILKHTQRSPAHDFISVLLQRKIRATNKSAWYTLPSAWNTTDEALATLRSVQGRIKEKSFHEATHVLYDLRTTFGNRPVKYLEIGSFTGISASLMLSHPMPTAVTAVDPCILSKEFIQGDLSQEETIRKNLAMHTATGCHFKSPWKINVGFSPGALPVNETFDIIFIDGDHSTRGVWADYSGTLPLLRPGGFMVFDDYLDWQWSPEVRGAVDEIAMTTDLISIGTPRNIHGIHQTVNGSYINEYIFQKAGKFQKPPDVFTKEPLLCVTVATYQRKDGSSPSHLERLWQMLEGQSYTRWKLYLTGDKYEDESEWKTFSFANDSRVSMLNLLEPGERGKIKESELWSNAGATAMNNAIERALYDGNEWVVHLDDDDYWDTDHLSNIVSGILTGATFVSTICQYGDSLHLPVKDSVFSLTTIKHDMHPRPCDIVHSSIAFNAAKLPSRYEPYPGMQADSYMWGRIVFDDLFFPAFVPVPSCHHLSELGGAKHELVGRKFLFQDLPLPPGWYDGKDMRYTTLAIGSFPETVNPECQYVVGPEGEKHKDFVEVDIFNTPYHIRVVKELRNKTVWRRIK